MTNDDIKKIRGAVKEEINVALKPINRKLDILWDQVEKVTFGIDEVKETLDTHTSVLKRMETKLENHSDDIHKLDRRVVTLENNNGVVAPPELTII